MTPADRLQVEMIREYLRTYAAEQAKVQAERERDDFLWRQHLQMSQLRLRAA